jgi:dTDP-glucose pyrophosphorylase
MRDAGIDDIIVVVGHRGDQIPAHFGDGAQLGVKMRYVVDENPQGIAASLLTARDLVTGPFALFLGDIFIALDDLAPAIQRMSERGADGAVVVRQEPDLDVIRLNFSVITDGEGRISRVIEKPTDPPNTLKGCGVYMFTPEIFDAIKATPRSKLRNEYEITDAIQTLVNKSKGGIFSEELARWDWNITFPGDLLDLNLKVLRERQLDSLVGQGAVINQNTQLVSSIIGDRAVIEAPTLVEECLILADCKVDKHYGSLRRQIFADGLTWAA